MPEKKKVFVLLDLQECREHTIVGIYEEYAKANDKRNRMIEEQKKYMAEYKMEFRLQYDRRKDSKYVVGTETHLRIKELNLNCKVGFTLTLE